jgi:tungstate transport system ATP-binding protein
MNETIYRLETVRKLYGSRAVLAIEHLEVLRGEIFGLVGPSGAGKSTLLRLLALLETPSSGKLTFFGDTVMRSNSPTPGPVAARRRLAMVFQQPVLLNTTVTRNVAYGLRLRGALGIEQRAHTALAEVGLSELANSPARKLSGGEMQRVALARAIVLDPEVLLLDEPTANLDPYNVSLIERIATDLNRTRGTTIVLITHNVFQAKRLSHRTGLLLAGELVETKPTSRFFTDPDDPRTTAFVRGEMVY